jgi:putative ABC transport system permease protein
VSVLLRSVVADLVQGGARWRSLFIVVTVALGVAAFTALLASSSVLTREVDTGFRDTEPADFTVFVEPTNAEVVAAATTVAGVARAEARGSSRGRVRIGPLRWRPLQLIAPASFERVTVSRFFPQTGAWPPADDEILVERDALQVVRAGIGDSIVVRNAAGSEHTLRIVGTAYDPGQAQARMEEMVYGYVTKHTLERLGESGGLDRVLVRLDGAQSRADRKAIAATVVAAIEATGARVERTDLAKGHPHAALMGTLFHLEGAFGLLALLFTGFLCVQLFTAQMATQVRRIGVLKALGARVARVRRVYLVQAALLGLAATVVGLPLGVWGGVALSDFLAIYLNFDLHDRTVGPSLWVVALTAGIVVPVLAAWIPVRRGTRLSVAAAVVHHGIGATAFGTSRIDRLAARLGGAWLSPPVVLAVRNVFRRRARSCFAVVTIAVGGFLFLAAADARATLLGALDRFFGSRGYDLTLDLGSMQPMATVERAAAGVDGIVGIEGSITTRGTLGNRRDADTSGASGHMAAMLRHHGGDLAAFVGGPGKRDEPTLALEAIPASSTMQRADIVAGRLLRAGDASAIVVNEALGALAGDVRVGDHLSFTAVGQPVSCRVLGIVREPFAQAGGYVLRDEGVFSMHPGMVNTVRLRFAPGDEARRDGVRAALEERLGAEGIRVTGSRTIAETRYVFDQHFVMVYDCLVGIAALVLLVGAIALVSLLALDAIERRGEFAVLRALGAKGRTIGLLVLVQGCLLAVGGWGLALLAGRILAAFGGVARLFPTRLDPIADGSAPYVWLGVAITAGFAASVIPAARAARVTVREALTSS